MWKSQASPPSNEPASRADIDGCVCGCVCVGPCDPPHNLQATSEVPALLRLQPEGDSPPPAAKHPGEAGLRRQVTLVQAVVHQLKSSFRGSCSLFLFPTTFNYLILNKGFIFLTLLS